MSFLTNKFRIAILSFVLLTMAGCHYNPVSGSYAFRKPTLNEQKMFESYEKINDPYLTLEEREILFKQFINDVNRVIAEINRKNRKI
jgi:hypothetical protein